MAPPVALLLDDLVAAINAELGQAALGQAITARRGYQETQALTGQETAGLWLSPAQWRPLGRAGGLTLDQHTIDVRYIRSSAVPVTATLDSDVDCVRKLRSFLADFHGDHGRVVDVIGPLTVDRAKLAANQSAIGLLLDSEILTGEATSDPDPAEPSRLTIARNAVWQAIDDAESLAEVFARKYKTGGDFAELLLRDPAPWELPAIAVYWGGIQPNWKSNRTQEWPLTFRLTLWLPGDRHTFAETLCERVFDALYRTTAVGSTVPYIQAATGYPPRRVSEMSIQGVTLGRPQLLQALRVDVAFALRSNHDPFGE